MYNKTSQGHSYEVDQTNRLTLVSLFNYLQDVMIENADSYGASSTFHYEKGLAWVLVDYDIDIIDLPSAFEEITCETLPYSFKKYYGYRVYEAKEKQGIIAKGNGRFVLMDYIHKTLSLPSQEILDLFVGAHKEPKSLPMSKHRLIEGNRLKTMYFDVRKSDIDLNLPLCLRMLPLQISIKWGSVHTLQKLMLKGV